MYAFLFPGAASLAKGPQNCQPFIPPAEGSSRLLNRPRPSLGADVTDLTNAVIITIVTVYTTHHMLSVLKASREFTRWPCRAEHHPHYRRRNCLVSRGEQRS